MKVPERKNSVTRVIILIDTVSCLVFVRNLICPFRPASHLDRRLLSSLTSISLAFMLRNSGIP
jgi:hypothetical protein